jgi:carbonic anhydrase/acetyltransferase-like protein (isoleucine patch superfamily)
VGTGSIVLHRAVVESGALVGAGAVVPNDMLVPSGALALGVPAKLRPDAADRDDIMRIAGLYVTNAKRYRDELRLID